MRLMTYLCELHNQLEHVRDPFPSDGRGRHNVDVLPGVRILPVQGNIQALFIQVENCPLQILLVLANDMRLLLLQGVLDCCICNALPLEQPVYLHSNSRSR